MRNIEDIVKDLNAVYACNFIKDGDIYAHRQQSFVYELIPHTYHISVHFHNRKDESGYAVPCLTEEEIFTLVSEHCPKRRDTQISLF